MQPKERAMSHFGESPRSAGALLDDELLLNIPSNPVENADTYVAVHERDGHRGRLASHLSIGLTCHASLAGRLNCRSATLQPRSCTLRRTLMGATYESQKSIKACLYEFNRPRPQAPLGKRIYVQQGTKYLEQDPNERPNVARGAATR